jgi:DNA-binding Lrp family transcriptional regulator
MITTIVLVKAEPRLIPLCAKHLAGLDGVTEVYSVSGEWDLVVLVKVPQYEDIARIVTEQFPTVPGLVRTTTLTAFRAYSKADLEQGWDVGGEQQR